MNDKINKSSFVTKPIFDKYQEPNSEHHVKLEFKQDSNGKWICNNKSCPDCYFEPKEKQPKKRIPLCCAFGFHELHRWYISKYAMCRLCGKQIEAEFNYD